MYNYISHSHYLHIFTSLWQKCLRFALYVYLCYVNLPFADTISYYLELHIFDFFKHRSKLDVILYYVMLIAADA